MALFKHQEEGIEWLKKRTHAILADEMGLGKTRQAIIAAGDTSDETNLVICPASLKLNWQREIKAVYSDEEIVVVTGSNQDLPAEKPEWFRVAGWIIINYDILGRNPWLGEMAQQGKIGSVIIDEAHYIKGKSERATEVLELTKSIPIVYCLTGTPMLNRPAELFNLLKAVKHPLGKAKTVFAKRYCGGQMKALVRDLQANKQFFVDPKRQWPFRMQKDRYRVYVFMDDTGATHLEELRRFTDDVMLRRTKKEVLDLPPKIVSDVMIELDSEQRSRYETAWDAYLEWIGAHPDASRNIDNILTAQQLVEIGKLKQVCSLAKIARIVEDAENAVEQGQKIIIFSQYRQTISDLRVALAHLGVTTLTGDDDAEARQEAVDAFQTKDECKVFIANIIAGGVGINLTAASIVMFADLDWSPGVNEQAEDRAHRIGQEGTVNVYRYIADETIESDIVRILAEKKHVITDVI